MSILPPPGARVVDRLADLELSVPRFRPCSDMAILPSVRPDDGAHPTRHLRGMSNRDAHRPGYPIQDQLQPQPDEWVKA